MRLADKQVAERGIRISEIGQGGILSSEISWGVFAEQDELSGV